MVPGRIYVERDPLTGRPVLVRKPKPVKISFNAYLDARAAAAARRWAASRPPAPAQPPTRPVSPRPPRPVQPPPRPVPAPPATTPPPPRYYMEPLPSHYVVMVPPLPAEALNQTAAPSAQAPQQPGEAPTGNQPAPVKTDATPEATTQAAVKKPVQHVCEGCGRVRSTGFHYRRQLAGGESLPSFCRKCVSQETSSEDEGGDEASLRNRPLRRRGVGRQPANDATRQGQGEATRQGQGEATRQGSGDATRQPHVDAASSEEASNGRPSQAADGPLRRQGRQSSRIDVRLVTGSDEERDEIRTTTTRTVGTSRRRHRNSDELETSDERQSVRQSPTGSVDLQGTSRRPQQQQQQQQQQRRGETSRNDRVGTQERDASSRQGSQSQQHRRGENNRDQPDVTTERHVTSVPVSHRQQQRHHGRGNVRDDGIIMAEGSDLSPPVSRRVQRQHRQEAPRGESMAMQEHEGHSPPITYRSQRHHRRDSMHEGHSPPIPYRTQRRHGQDSLLDDSMVVMPERHFSSHHRQPQQQYRRASVEDEGDVFVEAPMPYRHGHVEVGESRNSRGRRSQPGYHRGGMGDYYERRYV